MLLQSKFCTFCDSIIGDEVHLNKTRYKIVEDGTDKEKFETVINIFGK